MTPSLTHFRKNALSHWIILLSGSLALSACNSNSDDKDTGTVNNGGAVDNGSVKLVPSQTAGTLESYLKGSLKSFEETSQIRLGADESASDFDGAAPAADTNSVSGGFSETNTQVLGIDESDLVKYDGAYLYIASSNQNYYYWIGDIAIDLIGPEIDIAPVESDGGIGDGATGEELLAADERVPVDSNGGIGDGATGEELIGDKADTDSFAPNYPEYQNNAYIRIMQTQQGDAPSATEAARIELDQTHGTISGMYLYQPVDNSSNANLLAVLSHDHQYYWEDWGRYGAWSETKTYLNLYNITHPAQYAKINTISIDGALIDSRRIENTLYLVTRYTPILETNIWYEKDGNTLATNDDRVDALTLSDLLPKTTNEQNGTSQALVDERNCFVPESAVSSYYSPALITITAIDLNNTNAMTSICVAGNNSGIYSSTEALYLFNDQWNEGTIVHKFALTETGTAYKGSGTIPGSLGWRAPSFRLHEKDGALIAVSTVYPDISIGIPTEPVILEDFILEDDGIRNELFATGSEPVYPTHKLTVLKESGNNELTAVATLPSDAQPTVIGKPNEDIYAVRYIDDRGYIVTYQKTDPLYVVDLADVANPKITGELHIEGYSDYLHPFGSEYLLGIGKASTVQDNTAWLQGVQVGLFDVKNLNAPALVKQIELGKRGSDTVVSYNHKAFSLLQQDESSYRLAFPVNIHDGEQKHPSDWTPWQYNGLQLFDLNLGAAPSIDKAGIVVAEKYEGTSNYRQYVDVQRGILHGDTIHYVYGENVLSADWNNPEATATKLQ